MTPVAGLLIAILVGLLVRGPRQALVAATPPWLAILLEQTWLLGSGRGNNPSSTISDPGYWVVQGISLALVLGIASGLSLWRSRRAGDNRRVGASTGSLALVLTLAAAVIGGVIVFSATGNHTGSGSDAPPLAGVVGLVLGVLVLAVLGIVVLRQHRDHLKAPSGYDDQITPRLIAILIVGSMVVGSVSVASAQTQSEPIALLQQLAAAFTRDDRAAAIALFSDQAIVIGGPCVGPPAGGECVGRAQIERVIYAGDPVQVNFTNLQVVGDGNTVTLRAEEHFPLPPQAVAAGVSRMREIGTAVISAGKIDQLALVADVTDSQTVTLHHVFRTLGPPPGSPGAAATGDGQTLATQSAATQALFSSVYGDQAAAQWARQHQAALSR